MLQQKELRLGLESVRELTGIYIGYTLRRRHPCDVILATSSLYTNSETTLATLVLALEVNTSPSIFSQFLKSRLPLPLPLPLSLLTDHCTIKGTSSKSDWLKGLPIALNLIGTNLKLPTSLLKDILNSLRMDKQWEWGLQVYMEVRNAERKQKATRW